MCAILALATACGSVREESPPVAAPVVELASAHRLAVGWGFSCVLQSGHVVCWGGGVPEGVDARPHVVAELEGAIDIVAHEQMLCSRRSSPPSSGRSRTEVECVGLLPYPSYAEPEPPVVDPEDHTIVPLAGARAITIAGLRVCGIVGSELVCVDPTHVVTRVPGVPVSASLSTVGAAPCIADGVLPARCVRAGEDALSEVPGSTGAVSIAEAAGVCAILAGGALVCADGELGAAPLVATDVVGATAIVGNESVRCVVRADAVECSGWAEPERLVVPGSFVEAALSTRGSDHLCVLPSSGPPSCIGDNTEGQAAPPRTAWGVRRVEEAPPDLVDVTNRFSAVEVLDREGRRFVIEGRGSALARDGIERFERLAPAMALCGVTHAGAVVCPEMRWHREHFTLTYAFGAIGPVIACSDDGLCARTRRGVAVAHPTAGRRERPTGAFLTITGLRGGTDVFAHGSDVCARFGTAIRCHPLLAFHPPPVDTASPLAGDIPPVRRVLGGASQILLEDTSGRWLAMGHNGVGQLGLPPSRPLGPTPVTLPVSGPDVRAAFAEHASCVWAPGTALYCAGLDEQLFIRGTEGDDAPDRGDGSFREIPGVRDVRAVMLGGTAGSSCAIDGEGVLWCWGGSAAMDAPARADVATPVTMTPL